MGFMGSIVLGHLADLLRVYKFTKQIRISHGTGQYYNSLTYGYVTENVYIYFEKSAFNGIVNKASWQKTDLTFKKRIR